MRAFAFLLTLTTLAGSGWAQPAQMCGGAMVPTWVTAGRPTGAVSDQTTGYNVTTGMCETYSATFGSWMPTALSAMVAALVASGFTVTPGSGPASSTTQFPGAFAVGNGLQVGGALTAGSGQVSGALSVGTALQVGKSIQLSSPYTVSTLPTCNSATKGTSTVVTDALLPSFAAALAGGGAVTVGALCNGSAWMAY